MRVFITGASGFIGRALCERSAADVGLHMGLERTIGWLREQGYGSR